MKGVKIVDERLDRKYEVTFNVKTRYYHVDFMLDIEIDDAVSRGANSYSFEDCLGNNHVIFLSTICSVSEVEMNADYDPFDYTGPSIVNN